MLGEPVAAETAKEIGLVNAIVPAEALVATALATARKLATKPAASPRETKMLMKQGIHEAVKLAMGDWSWATKAKRSASGCFAGGQGGIRRIPREKTARLFEVSLKFSSAGGAGHPGRAS